MDEDKRYEKYVEIGGKLKREQFDKNCDVFVKKCVPSYNGTSRVTRKTAFESWQLKCGLTPEEADLHFEAIDYVMPLVKGTNNA